MKNPNKLQLDFGFDIEPISNQKETPKNEKKDKQDFVFEFMDALTSPIIVFPSLWKDMIPKVLLDKITISRMICMSKGEQMASLVEVVAYMMPRTLESPMHSEWVNIYTWCGLQYATMFNGTEQKEDMVTAMKDIAPEKLSDYEQRLLKDLRIWIYDKRRKALKETLKSEKKSKPKMTTTVQSNLFDTEP